jgi:hypothetical protein
MPHFQYKPAGNDSAHLPRQNFTITNKAARAQYSGPQLWRVTYIPTDFNSPIELESTVKMNFWLKSTWVRQGFELSLLCSFSKAFWAFWASTGKGPPFQALSLPVSSVSGSAVWVKLSMVL